VKPEELKSQGLGILATIAPELEPGELRGDKPLRSQVDLDSMDWLNFLVALHERLKVEIPETDYAKLVTLDDLLAYLKGKLGG
jgi:acyl carrier protein